MIFSMIRHIWVLGCVQEEDDWSLSSEHSLCYTSETSNMLSSAEESEEISLVKVSPFLARIRSITHQIDLEQDSSGFVCLVPTVGRTNEGEDNSNLVETMQETRSHRLWIGKVDKRARPPYTSEKKVTWALSPLRSKVLPVGLSTDWTK